MKYNPHLCLGCQLDLKWGRSEYCEECFKKMMDESIKND